MISFSPFLVKDNSFESKISVSKVLKFLGNERAVCRNSREYICTNLILFLLNIFCCLVLSSCLSNDDPFFHWNLIFEVRFRNEFYKFVQDKRSHDIFNHTNWFRCLFFENKLQSSLIEITHFLVRYLKPSSLFFNVSES